MGSLGSPGILAVRVDLRGRDVRRASADSTAETRRNERPDIALIVRMRRADVRNLSEPSHVRRGYSFPKHFVTTVHSKVGIRFR